MALHELLDAFWVMEFPLDGTADYPGQHHNSMLGSLGMRNAQVTDPVPSSRNSLSCLLGEYSAMNTKTLKLQNSIEMGGNGSICK